MSRFYFACCVIWVSWGCGPAQEGPTWDILVDSVRVLSIAETPGIVWVGTDGGLIRLDQSGQSLLTPANSPLQNLAITKLATDDNGSLWIVNGNSGTWRVDVFGWTLMTGDSGLPNNRILDLDHGKAGLLIVSANEIAAYRDGHFTQYTPPSPSWLYSPFTAVTQDNEGTLWVGTSGGGLIQIRDSIWTRFTPSNSPLQSLTVYDIQPDGKTGIWIGEGGLTHYLNGIWLVDNITNSPLPQNDVVAIGVRDADDIWVGTLDAGTARIRNDKWDVFQTTNSPLPSNRISCIVLLARCVLLGTSFGVVRIRF